MKHYCLDDIVWIYTRDGKFANPFIFNKENTKMKDLFGSKVIEIDTATTTLSIKRYFANLLHSEENNIYIAKFVKLVVNGPLTSKGSKLQLKGIRNLKFAKLKHDILKNGGSTKYYETFIVNDNDIKNITRELIKCLHSKVENLHNQTTNF